MKRVQILVERFIATDGKMFEHIEKAEHHEKMLSGERVTCDECDGSGHVDMYGDGKWMTSCDECGGKGWLERAVVYR